MDKNSNAKQSSKKSQMAVEKSKKSASKKKKRSKKLLSAKSDQSPDSIEVEGVRALEQPGGDSDSSCNRQQNTASPLSQKSSVLPESESEPTAKTTKSSPSDNENKSKSRKKLPEETRADPVYLKATNSSTYLNDTNNKKASVSFSDFQEIQTISSTLSNMSVKSKNGSQRNKNKSSKSSSNGAAKRERTEKPKAEPIKSSINKAAEEAARKQSEESLRWEFTLENEEEEEERMRIYKMNRRKRYLAAAQEKGLGWVVNYGKNGSPVADESLPDASPERETHASVTDFSPVRSIMASQSSTPLSLGGEIAC